MRPDAPLALRWITVSALSPLQASSTSQEFEVICEACRVYGNVHSRMEAVLTQRLLLFFKESNGQTLHEL